MKDTEIPLDIIFVNQDGNVISVKQGEPNSEELITESSEFISCVIELNINSGVKAGDKIVSINGKKTKTLDDIQLYMALTGDNETEFVMSRNKEEYLS